MTATVEQDAVPLLYMSTKDAPAFFPTIPPRHPPSHPGMAKVRLCMRSECPGVPDRW